MQKQIKLEPVSSSQIKAIGHDEATNTLAIQFPNKKDGTLGSVYHYSNFDAEAFKLFRDAESIGSHFIRHIKPAIDKHPFVKIDLCGKINNGHACTMPKGSECPDCCGIRGETIGDGD